MGSIGGWELVLILLLALLLFGPRKLPQIGRTLGKALGDLRRATTDLKINLEREVNLEEVKDLQGSIRSASREVTDTVSQLRDLGVSPSPPSPSKPGDAAVSSPAPPPPSTPETGDPEVTPDPAAKPDAGIEPTT